MKAKAIRLHENGSPSVMKWESVELGDPGRGEILVRNTAVGFNMVDTYVRSGLYPSPAKPCGLGAEAAGVVEAVGKGVKGFKAGDRVCYAFGTPQGAYAEARIMPTGFVLKTPGWLDDQVAAAVLTKGRTVEYLFDRTHKLKKGETILFHAAAGGVGTFAGQWAKSVGARAIGVVSTGEKAKIARRNGYAHVIVTANTDITEEVMRITRGEGVDVVYDSVGKDTWQASLESVRKLGLVVSFGSASGSPPPFDVAADGLKKSAFIHRATMVNYMTSEEIAAASARKVFSMIKKGALKPRIDATYKLSDAARVHRDAEARKTTGQIVMIP
jgi:NADPH2:quinone reductase